MTDTLTRIDDDSAWAAFEARDYRQDGRFVGAVKTTGIYCKPSCPARHPLRQNVEFFADGAAARAAGYRACLRCRPDEVGRDRAAVEAAIAVIRGADSPPRLSELAKAQTYSPAHFQRLFKRHTGLSPAHYARVLRQDRAKSALVGADSVTGAIYDAGYAAPSRFYDETKGRLGMTASAWKDGGRGVSIAWAIVPTSVGDMLVAASDKGICWLSFNEDASRLQRRFPNAELEQGGEGFADLLAQVVASVEAPGDFAHIPLDVQGTAFQEAVWRALAAIPAGETRTYGEIAASIGKPKAVRAVGSACGKNHVAVLIPCHRALRSDGTLGGYAYGLDIKRDLLGREGV